MTEQEAGPPTVWWCREDERCADIKCVSAGHTLTEGKPRGPGPIELALEDDLGRADLDGAGRKTLAAMARKLARVIDARGEDEPASQTAKAIETLRITLDKILSRETDDPDVKRRLEALLQTPSDGGSSVPPALRYPPKP
jgi:hypothetical protein